MPRGDSKIREVAATALTSLDSELFLARERQLSAVTHVVAGGSGNIDSSFGPDVRFRLVFVRCHFVGGSSTAAMTITLDSVSGASYDCLLFTILTAGPAHDVNFRIPANESEDPSPWTFQAGDRLRIQWANPGGTAWGLEVGLTLAS
ncbi:MAG: hypothetical protein HY287_05850 [Planctomycetes bacterium]|nr:hypothetical protein [Planctomycetota bacterium]MBI3833835.1 hypothetical protein [Planctomycetota bacterium]